METAQRPESNQKKGDALEIIQPSADQHDAPLFNSRTALPSAPLEGGDLSTTDDFDLVNNTDKFRNMSIDNAPSSRNTQAGKPVSFSDHQNQGQPRAAELQPILPSFLFQANDTAPLVSPSPSASPLTQSQLSNAQSQPLLSPQSLIPRNQSLLPKKKQAPLHNHSLLTHNQPRLSQNAGSPSAADLLLKDNKTLVKSFHLPHGVEHKKPIQNGRVPATKHDNRKLFVGGLPNEVTDHAFLKFFEQFGTVIDSVVLLDRRTKRSRGFGFVTFADEEVAQSLLTTIPGRTGRVVMMGKVCEVKASEPKTAEPSHPTDNLHSPNGAINNINMNHHHSRQAWPNHAHRLAFGGPTSPIHPYPSNHGYPQPADFNYGRRDGRMPAFSYTSTTSTELSSPGTSNSGAPATYIIQNNFYTVPLPPHHSAPTSEELQQHQQTTHQFSADGTFAQYAYPGSVWEPSFPGLGGGPGDDRRQQPNPRHPNNFAHFSYRGI